MKLRERNSRGDTSGFFRFTIMNGNAIAATAPINRLVSATGSPQPRCCPRIVPKASPPTASTITIDPSQSKCPVASGSFDSGTYFTVAR